MKNLFALLPAALIATGGLVFAPLTVSAQAPAVPAREVLVDIKKVNVGVQKTPKIQFDGPTDKRWTPKDWLEIEVDCDVQKSKKSKDPKQTAYPEATFKYYVYLEGQTKEKARILTGEVTHASVPIDKDQHSVMYVTPSTILELTGRKEGNPAAVKYWGVIVTIAGETVGYKVSPNAPGTVDKPWWDIAGGPAKQEGLLKKSETPFSILWADYHLDERTK